MSDPKRLLDELGGGQELGRLLRAGKSEVPDEAQMIALAAKIGIAGGLGGAGAAGALGGGGAAGGAGGGSASAGAGAAAAKVAVGATKAGLAVKIGGAVVVASAGIGASVVATSARDDAPPTPAGIVATPAGSSVSSAPAIAPSRAADDGTPDIDVAPPSDPSASITSPRPAASARRPAPAPSAEGPEAEVRLLERAQDALRSRPTEALALADDHARRFPHGMLVQEREVIAIEALVKTGRTTEAKARAARFKARFVGSSHARRIDTLVGD